VSECPISVTLSIGNGPYQKNLPAALARRGMLRRVFTFGPTPQIFAPPYHPYTEKLISSVPEMDTTWLDQVLASRGGVAA